METAAKFEALSAALYITKKKVAKRDINNSLLRRAKEAQARAAAKKLARM